LAAYKNYTTLPSKTSQEKARKGIKKAKTFYPRERQRDRIF